MKNFYIYVVLLVLFPTLIFGQNFGYKMITINTVPSGATLYLNDKPIGESPATVRVQNGLLAPNYIIRAELNGYKKKLIPLDQHWIPGLAIAGGCCGLLFLPAIGMIIYAKEHDSIYTIYLQKHQNIDE